MAGIRSGVRRALFAAFVAVAVPLHALVIYVRPDGDDAASGLSWTEAVQSIQVALDLAAAAPETDPDRQVWVAQGDYLLNAPLIPAGSVRLAGGFNGTERTFAERDWKHRKTVVNGQSLGFSIFRIVGVDGVVVDGFTIVNGGGFEAAVSGGGAYLANTNAVFANCTFVNNWAASDGDGGGMGGAVFILGGGPFFDHCEFLDNRASASGAAGGLGGAVAVMNGGVVRFDHCFFDNNEAAGADAGGSGGAVYAANADTDFSACFFVANRAAGLAVSGRGGAAWLLGGTHRFVNSGFVFNAAEDPNYIGNGGAVAANADVTVINCTLARNSAGQSGVGGAIFNDAGTMDVENCIVWDNQADVDPQIHEEAGSTTTVNYSDVQGGAPGIHNIDVDPRFTDPDRGRIDLRYDSPCIDQGDPTVAPPDDMFGTPRPVGVGVDLGFQERIMVWYVRPGGAGMHNGTSWEDAFAGIDDALPHAVAGDEIWVAGGVYKPAAGTKDASFVIPAGVGLYGGFSGCEARREERNWQRNPTILSGDVGVPGDPADNTSHVVTADQGAVLDGFLVRDGNAGAGRGLSPMNGGGLLCLAGDVTVRHCTFRNNRADGGGGAVYASGEAWGVFEDCSFEANSAGGPGGAVLLDGCTRASSFDTCRFFDNTSNGAGGALAVSQVAGDVVLVNNVFADNYAELDGSAVDNVDGSLVLVNCTVFDGSEAAGALVVGRGSGARITVRNCILWTGSAPAAPVLSCEGILDVARSDVAGGAPGVGNISADPLFQDGVNRDFSLRPGSPCIDAADSGVVHYSGEDAVGASRFDDPATPNTGAGTPPPDMGAFEYTHIYVALPPAGDDATGDGTIAHPFATIQRGIDAAPWMGVVLVDDGTYSGPGNTNIEFRGKAVKVMPWHPGRRGAVVIDCLNTEGARGVIFRSGEPPEATLESIVIRNGNETEAGGGILCINEAAPTIRGCRIEQCAAGTFGGGVAVQNAAPYIVECVIAANTAQADGGGVFSESAPEGESGGTVVGREGGDRRPPWDRPFTGATVLEHSRVIGNWTGGSGGGVSAAGMGLVVEHCVVVDNVASLDGGGLFLNAGTVPEVFGSIVSDNRAGGRGGGLFMGEGRLRDTFVTGNHAAGEGGGAFLTDNGEPTELLNVVFGGNEAGTTGGGLIAEGGSPRIVNCTLAGNSAGEHGDGAACVWNATPRIINTIFDNVAQSRAARQAGEELYVYAGSLPTVEYCLIDAAKVVESDGGQVDLDAAFNITDGTPAGLRPELTGSWSAAPVYDPATGQTTLTDASAQWSAGELKGRILVTWTAAASGSFVVADNGAGTVVVWGDATQAAVAGGDYRITDWHLDADSVCIDAGNGAEAPETDLEGDVRYDDPSEPNLGPAEAAPADIGVDEYTPQAQEPAGIAGRVWDDLDFDGVQDAGEPGLDGVTVRLLKADGGLVQETSTSGGGGYQFAGIVPGTYMVEFVAPDGRVFSPRDQGDDASDSDADPATGRTGLIDLPPGTVESDVDAGVHAVPQVELVVVSAVGEPTPAVGTHTYNRGAAVDLFVEERIVEDEPGGRWLLTGWTGAGDVPAHGTGASVGSVVLNQDSTVAWRWQRQWTLTVTTAGEGNVLRTPHGLAAGEGAHWYPTGTDVLLEAVAAPNWHFVEWTGDLPAGADPAEPALTVTMDRARQIAARFEFDGSFRRYVRAVSGEIAPAAVFGLDATPEAAEWAPPEGDVLSIRFHELDDGDFERLVRTPAPDVEWLLVVHLPPVGDAGGFRQVPDYDGLVHLRWDDAEQGPDGGWPESGSVPIYIERLDPEAGFLPVGEPVNMREVDEWPEVLTADPDAGLDFWFRIYPEAMHRLTLISTAPGMDPPVEIGDPRGAGVYPHGAVAAWSVTSPWPDPDDAGKRYVTYTSSGTVVMDRSRTVIVPWELQRLLELAVEGPGRLDTAGGWYPDGANVQIEARPEPHAHFVEWRGDVPPGKERNRVLRLEMDRARAITAVFAWDVFDFTVESPYGTPFLRDADGTESEGTGLFRFAYGTALIGSVRDPILAVADGERMMVAGWEWRSGSRRLDAGTGASTAALTVFGDSRLVWSWRRQFLLDVAVAGEGAIAVDPEGDPAAPAGRERATAGAWWYFENARVRLTAIPAPGYVFDGWEGDVPPEIADMEVEVVLDRPRHVVARFRRQAVQEPVAPDPNLPERNLETLISGRGNVQVQRILPGGVVEPAAPGAFVHGSLVELNAVPSEGWRFNRWYGDLPPDTNPWNSEGLRVLMDRDRSITADFVPALPIADVHAFAPVPNARDVHVLEPLAAVIDRGPTDLVPIGAQGADAQPGGPEYRFLAGRMQVTLAEYVRFLNDVLAHGPAPGASDMFVDEVSGCCYYRADFAPCSLLFDPRNTSEPGLFDYGVRFVPAADGGPAFTYDPAFAEFPVVGVTWYGAVKYCNWLTARKGLGRAHWCYTEGSEPQDWHPAGLTVEQWADGFSEEERRQWLFRFRDGFRLPMDGGAARTGPFNEFYKMAAWDGTAGENRDEGAGGAPNAWDDADEYNGPLPASAALPNYFGLDHALGNVWVWLSDPFDPDAPDLRTVRGWGWWNRPRDVSAATRWRARAHEAFSDVGFRVVCGRDYLVRFQTADSAEFATRGVQDSGWQIQRQWFADLEPGRMVYWRVTAEYPGGLLPPAAGWFGAGAARFDLGLDTRIAPADGSWQPVQGTLGRNDGLWMLDADADGRWQPGEPVWGDVGRNGVYDAGVDVQIDGGEDGWTTPNGARGRSGLLCFHDEDGDGRFDLGEDVWRDNGARGRYDAGLDWLVYDGGNGGRPVDGMPGTQAGLWYNDSDGDGAYDPGDDLWRDEPGGTPGVYDDGIDTRVFDGGNGWETPGGAAGIQTGVFYSDVDLDERYSIDGSSHGEDIWLDAGRPGVYDEDVDTPVTGGFDGWSTPDGAPGTETALFVRDENTNGRWDESEDVWADVGRDGFYDPGVDVLLAGGDPPDADAAGTHGDLLGADADRDGSWNPETDDVWADRNDNGAYDPGEPLLFGEWHPVDGTPGTGGQILYEDLDGDMWYTEGEPLWADALGLGTPGAYDPGTDLLLIGPAPAGGALGCSNGVFFADADGNGRYDDGEDVWVKARWSVFRTSNRTLRQVAIPVTRGWNLVSVPVYAVSVDVPPDMAPSFSAWAWNREEGRYERITMPEPGRGYWFYADADGRITVTGWTPDDPRVFVRPGWNLVGVVQPIRNLNPASLVLPIYWWTGAGYAGEDERTAIELRLLRGYWIRVPEGSGPIELREWDAGP